ncbi:hypothetical protein N9B39_03205, partial [bacterium]|nr:hypothetical protein [bacterium]
MLASETLLGDSTDEPTERHLILGAGKARNHDRLLIAQGQAKRLTQNGLLGFLFDGGKAFLIREQR